MAEIGLIASVVGVVTVGAKLSKLLYTYGRAVHKASSEIDGVAHEIESLTAVLDEICTLLQATHDSRHGRLSSRKALHTIESIVGGCRGLYEEIENIFPHDREQVARRVSKGSNEENSSGPSLGKKLQWSFQQKEVELLRARARSYMTMLTLMFTTLTYAEMRRRSSLTGVHSSTSAEASSAPPPYLPRADPKLIHEQVIQAVVSADNLDRLEEEARRSRLKITIPTAQNLEPRHYVYQTDQGGGLMRQNPSESTLWLSELVNVGDEHSLARRGSNASLSTVETFNTERKSRSIIDDNEETTAECLLKEWSTLRPGVDANTWEIQEDFNDSLDTNDIVRASSEVTILSSEVPVLRRSEYSKAAVRNVLVASLGDSLGDNREWNSSSWEPVWILKMAEILSTTIHIYWVIPRSDRNSFDLPVEEEFTTVKVSVDGQQQCVQVRQHHVDNITYVVLDAPLFRDILDSVPYLSPVGNAPFFSAWNQCIARVTENLSPDVFHITNFYSAVAPLYLLPKTVPCCVSPVVGDDPPTWPMNTSEASAELCSVFNLDSRIIIDYAHVNGSFNMLQAFISYLKIHQDSRGAAVAPSAPVPIKDESPPSRLSLSGIKMTRNFLYSLIGRSKTKVVDYAKLQIEQHRTWVQYQTGLERNPKAELFAYITDWGRLGSADIIKEVMQKFLQTNRNAQLVVFAEDSNCAVTQLALFLKLRDKFPRRVSLQTGQDAGVHYDLAGQCDFVLAAMRDGFHDNRLDLLRYTSALFIGVRKPILEDYHQGWFFDSDMTDMKVLEDQFTQAITTALASSHQNRASMRAIPFQQTFRWAAWGKQIDLLQRNVIGSTGDPTASVDALRRWTNGLSKLPS